MTCIVSAILLWTAPSNTAESVIFLVFSPLPYAAFYFLFVFLRTHAFKCSLNVDHRITKNGAGKACHICGYIPILFISNRYAVTCVLDIRILYNPPNFSKMGLRTLELVLQSLSSGC